MKPSRIVFRWLAGAAAIMLAAAPAARASSSSSSNVLDSSGGTSNSGATSSSVTTAGGHAQSGIAPATATMNGGVAVDNSIAHTFDASTSVNHSDSWACAGGSTCALAGTVTVPVNFHFTLDGTETGSGSWNLLATYSTSIGTAFSVSIAQSGANTFSASAKLNGQAVPVTVTGGYGDSSFSVDAGVTVNYQLSTHSATMFNDSQEISLTAQPLAGDAASLNVPIFKVSLTPLDPNLIMASADGRIASPVPEPSHALLFALGAAALVATRWSRRQR